MQVIMTESVAQVNEGEIHSFVCTWFYTDELNMSALNNNNKSLLDEVSQTIDFYYYICR